MARSSSGVDVTIVGLQGLVAALRRMERGSARELTTELNERVGREFVSDVKERINHAGFKHPTGNLAGTIKSSYRAGGVVVRSTPPQRPGGKSRLGYAAVYEYGYGSRHAFLNPTFDSWIATGKMETTLRGYLDWLALEWSV